jgi:putative transposase
MDWHSRKVLAWRLSNTLTADFCVEALEEALWRHVAPDQGSQFNSDAFTRVLHDAGVTISNKVGATKWVSHIVAVGY